MRKLWKAARSSGWIFRQHCKWLLTRVLPMTIIKREKSNFLGYVAFRPFSVARQEFVTLQNLKFCLLFILNTLVNAFVQTSLCYFSVAYETAVRHFIRYCNHSFFFQSIPIRLFARISP